MLRKSFKYVRYFLSENLTSPNQYEHLSILFDYNHVIRHNAINTVGPIYITSYSSYDILFAVHMAIIEYYLHFTYGNLINIYIEINLDVQYTHTYVLY